MPTAHFLRCFSGCKGEYDKDFYLQELIIEKKIFIPYSVVVYYLCTFFKRFE